MRLTCPCCQAEFPLEAALNDVAARQAVVRAFRQTPYGDLLTGYVGLFKPEKRAISMARLAKLLDELLDMIAKGTIERGGRIYSAPQAYWQQGLEEMLARRDSLTLPLKSHGYLVTIVAGYSDKAEAKAEAKAEERKRHGGIPAGRSKQVRGAAPLSLKDTLKQLNQGGSDGNQA